MDSNFDDDAAQQGSALLDSSQEYVIQELLSVLYTHKNRQAAIAAAARAIKSLQQKKVHFSDNHRQHPKQYAQKV